MADIERLLSSYKEELDDIEIPEDMEARMRESLNKVPARRRTGGFKKIAVLVIAMLLIGYNFDSLAYYGRKFIGYDNVMRGTLKELDELGEGQIIDKSYEFKNGVKVTLDGIMMDDNNLIAFCTINAPQGNVEEVYSNLRISMEGLFGNKYDYSAQGEISEDGKEMKWIVEVDKPKFYEKKMKFNIELFGDEMESGAIEFKIDRNKAMGHTLRILVNTEIEIGQRKIEIKELLASPTSTVIKGNIKNTVDIGADHKSKEERLIYDDIELALMADGKEVLTLGSSMGSSLWGAKFEMRYDALPKDTKRIDIKLVSLSVFEDINKTFELNKGKENDNISVLDREIIINDIYESEGNTYMEITSYEDLVLSNIKLIMDGVEVEPERIIPGDYEKVEKVETDSLNRVIKRERLKFTRTIEFKGTGENLELKIERVKLNKEYDEIIFTYEEK